MKLHLFVLILLSFSSCGTKKEEVRQENTLTQQNEKQRQKFLKYGNVKPYKILDIDEETLIKCINASNIDASCDLNTLPSLGMDNKKITIDRILSRTLVSHKFMGDNFKEALKELKSDNLNKLFGAATSIVLTNTVTSSFYTSTTGTFFIHPMYLWQSQEQRVISLEVEDDRGSDYYSSSENPILKFEYFELTRINNKKIKSVYSEGTRTSKEIRAPLFRVLVHELTHANDSFPYSVYSNPDLDRTKKFGEITYDRFLNYKKISDNLLKHDKSRALIFFEEDRIENNRMKKNIFDMSAEDFKSLYTSDLTVDMYSYFSMPEELGMYIERLITLSEYNMVTKQGVKEYPENKFSIPEDYKYPLAWAQINRILEPKILERVLDAAKRVIPNFDEQKTLKLLSKHSLITPDMPMTYEEFKKLEYTSK